MGHIFCPMKNKINVGVYVLLICLLAACAGSRKIDFKTAYKFSTYPYKHKNSAQAAVTATTISTNEPGLPLVADAGSHPVQPARDPMDKMQDHLYTTMGLSKEQATSLSVEALQDHVSHLSRKQKKEVRKTIRQEFKTFQQHEVAAGTHPLHTQHISSSGDYTRLAIIVGGVGLILLIVGAVFSVGLLSFFGALAVVGGAVLFIMGQV